MKILVITQYYPPEPGATSNRLLSFVEAMVKRGHEVTVICEFPNHPTGKLAPGDKWRLFRVENKDSHKIVRTFVMTFTRKNNVKRMLFYLSFAFSSFIAALFFRRHDVVFTSSPPIFHAFTAMLAAKIKRSKFVLDIRDLWPDSALEVEAVSNNTLLKLGSYLEQKIYLKAMKIFTVSEGIKKRIEQRGGIGKVFVSYNGTFKYMTTWNGDRNNFRTKRGWSEKIVVMYAGIIGLGQNLIDLLPEITRFNNSNILFEFIGDGPQKVEFADCIKKNNINNIRLNESIPVKEVIPYIYCSDIMIVVLRELEFFKSAIPSKFFDYMAAGKPVVTNVDGELREIMEKHNTGLYFSLRDKGSFKNAIEALANDPDKRRLMGENGKKLVEESFLRSKLAENAVKLIENSISS